MLNGLEAKIIFTEQCFEEAYKKYKNIFVAWTGGKDSTVALFLWKRFLEQKNPNEKVKALNIDTGLKFPEIIEFRDKWAKEWNIDLLIVRPKVNLLHYDIAKDKVKCCRDLKILPLQEAIKEKQIEVLITGIRGDEHPDREKRQCFEKRNSPSYMQLNPLLEWKEIDIWTFTYKEKLPYCSLYDKGYRSLGCMPCTSLTFDSEERSGRDKEKESKLSILTSLGYF
ncbi:phosphoadenylylsulfate reductase (thioredoxin) [Desulfonauticus submarinus]|uniref:Phosphoadenylylsulfate reductase (Thioredoxin) n=1 Tax=Desulfonauticus submarinus TaxID=206665 RepID=A0A1H0DMW2_9BACT|nr:phosphoadenosine phosphosulfate reductase family protein [Desulfonauticus submarinus]SDN71494.1 phosphoadenylylsulfate reductase (thioredoxin) [Desulfonauticus submarinus]